MSLAVTVLVSRRPGADFHQRDQIGGIEPVGVEETVRIVDELGQAIDQYGRRRRGNYGAGRNMGADGFQGLFFGFENFRDAFKYNIGAI